MMRLRRQTRTAGWLLAIAVVVLVDVVVLLGVARNRGGEPDAVVTLTENELPLVNWRKENTGIYLKLQWRRDWTAGQEWLDAGLLAELGFDCEPPLDRATIERHYDKLLPREGYVVLEYDGEAWATHLEEKEREIEKAEARLEEGGVTRQYLKGLRDTLERERVTGSRLLAVDAGADPDALRREYPDGARSIILPAVFDVFVYRGLDGKDDPELRGRVRDLMLTGIHVSNRHRATFDALDSAVRPLDDKPVPPRYSVTVKWGRRYEPWVEAVAPL